MKITIEEYSKVLQRLGDIARLFAPPGAEVTIQARMAGQKPLVIIDEQGRVWHDREADNLAKTG